MAHLQSYPRERPNRGVIPGGRNSTQQRPSTDDPRAEPFRQVTFGESREANSINEDHRNSNGREVGALSLLAYAYSPLEHSTTASVFNNWQRMPGAAASGLADVVLGEAGSGDMGVAAGGSGGGTQSRTYQLAVKRTILSVLASLGFGFLTMVFRGRQLGLEFLAGYLVEQSLSESMNTLPESCERPGRVTIIAVHGSAGITQSFLREGFVTNGWVYWDTQVFVLRGPNGWDYRYTQILVLRGRKSSWNLDRGKIVVRIVSTSTL